MMCAGVFMGTCSWVVGFSGFLTWLGQWRKRWWLAAADRIGGIMLLVDWQLTGCGIYLPIPL